MRLLKVGRRGELSLTEDFAHNIPPYAILSHTWGADKDEITFDDVANGLGKSKHGYTKIEFCWKQARKDGLEHIWVDTCCINKANHTELSEAITSMFRWYHNAVKCYVYLSDVSARKRDKNDQTRRTWEPAFRMSRWFTRGWTLQELLAPKSVEFFSREGDLLGDKKMLEQQIYEITGVPITALHGTPLSHFSVDERMRWAAKRDTKREEDKAYCLQGIFEIYMPLIYGERENAFNRLQEEIDRSSRKSLNQLPYARGAIFNAYDGDHATCHPANEDKQWQEYAAVTAAAYAKEVISVIPASQIPKTLTTKVERPLLNEEQKKVLLHSLRFNQIEARHMTIKKAHAKTCTWLLRKSEYLDWLDPDKLSQHHGFLWIQGKPGAGKSTLMKFVSANARKTMKDGVVISFFFNARGDDLEKSTVGMYRSLLLQLLEQLPALQSVFNCLGLATWNSECYEWSIESLKALLDEAVQVLGETSLVCLIDALDECDESQIRDMVVFFQQLGELAISTHTRLRVLFSSRHYPYITIKKGLSLTLEGQEGHDQDITNYINSELRIGHTDLSKQIGAKLQEKASGVFMWVVLVVDVLNKEHDEGRTTRRLQQKLEDIPGDLHKLFRDLLTRDCRNRDELLLCIQWVLFARQPLKPEQLYYGILSGTEPEHLSKWDSNEMPKDAIKRFILNSSKGLTEITKSGVPTVHFIHESVRDFLLKENGLSEVWSHLGNNFQGESHERLKHCCLQYMSIACANSLCIGNPLPKASTSEAAILRQSAAEAFPFLEYAVQAVLYHANAAQAGGVDQRLFLHSFQLAEWARKNNVFEKHEVRRHTPKVSLLYILAESDMSSLIRIHPSNLSCFEVEDERFGLPFFAAVATGSNETTRTLLEIQANNQPATSPFRNLCEQYYQNGNKRINFGRNFVFSKRKGVISYLAEHGDEKLLAFLCALGKFNIESNVDHGRTPLSWAAKRGHERVARLLLDQGADLESKDSRYGQTPLSSAAERRHEAVVRLLLERGADLESKDSRYGQTPLSLAAERGHEAVVRLLLEQGADLKSKDSITGQTPLLWAAGRGHEAVVRLLLERGADLESKDSRYGRTPLSLAAGRGHEAVVRLLLEQGADAKSEDSNGQTSLSWAAMWGQIAVVRLLLKQGADLESKDSRGQTPLLWAVEVGHEAVVRLLLEQGADLECKDSMFGRTPLLWAAGMGYEAVVRLLLEQGADLKSKDSSDRTPLSWAAGSGYKAVMSPLLEQGADLESKDSSDEASLS